MKKNKARRLSALLTLMLVIPAFAFAAPSYAQSGTTGTMTFPQTGRTVGGKFLLYWQSHGGVQQQGYPISEQMQEKSDTDGKVYTVQYFERAVFELHPENAAPNDVLLSLLGNFLYKQKYPNGAPSQQVSTAAGAVRFPQTGRTVGGKFLLYWQSHGGVAQQGYPISEEFQERSALDGKVYTVQYFERAVFELHPENAAPYDVLLSQLGTFQYKAKYSAGAPPPSQPAEVKINIVNFNFVPETVTVAVGTKITWTDMDESPHTVANLPDRKLFSSDTLRTGTTFSYTATTPGTIQYMCTLHPLMRGTIIVK